MVLPQRPSETESATEEDLIEMITRDSLIGTEQLQ
jgi:hypothetical protein